MRNFGDAELQLDENYGKVVCEPQWKWNRAHQPFHDYDYWYVWDGEGEVVLNGTSREVGRGSCFLFRPGDRTEARHRPERPLTVTYIHFSKVGDPAALAALPSFVRFGPESPQELYLDRFVHAMRSREHGREEEARMLLKLLLLCFERESRDAVSAPASAHPLYPVLSEVAAYVSQDPAKPHTIQSLARRAHLSPRYFSLQFKAIMGQTVEAYIIGKRIERARYLLRYQGMGVGEVAEALGYSSVYFFSRQFKQVTGLRPTDVKKQNPI
ncbi:AraC family transcriptional regulator [Paenibacillus sp.]|uniref:helix-turn-helix domain-containing protein n=1 Tax=Paenibacillus sp. TaxID=58172 RepID=UPI002D5C2ACC|nr:AraC family transcriptional regulator [Paenibacillus sp.]HZG56910.1 AraC family transcriptional regulator [Paenibacillus sp.]